MSEFEVLRTRGSARRPRSPLISYALAATCWAMALGLSQLVQAPLVLHQVALALHVLAMVAGFGAVLTVDWYGLAWLRGTRRLSETLRLAEAANPLIWLGVGGLLASGILLAPDLSRPEAWVKQAAVLVVALNGVRVGAMAPTLRALPDGHRIADLPPAARRRLLASIAVSQTAWWVAVLVGLWVSTSRRW